MTDIPWTNGDVLEGMMRVAELSKQFPQDNRPLFVATVSLNLIRTVIRGIDIVNAVHILDHLAHVATRGMADEIAHIIAIPGVKP